MKLLILRKKIITNAALSVILITLLALVIIYDSHKKKVARDEAQRVERETAKIRSKSVELQNKVAEAKKYEAVWKTIPNQRKFIGIPKIDDVIEKIDVLAEKYAIEKPAIKMTVPEELTNEIFKRSTIGVNVSTATLTFDALSDVKAISFITEFVHSVPGYIIIVNFDIKRTRKYNDQDLIQLSIGKGSGAVTGKVDFFWYLYKSKADPSKAPETIKQEEQLIEVSK